MSQIPTYADPNESSLLTALQNACAQRLKHAPYFQDVSVLTELQHDIEYSIREALAKRGCCVTILTPEASVNNHQDCPFPFFDKISIVAQVVENVTLNRSSRGTRKPAAMVAERTALYLHFFHPKISNILYLDNPSIQLVPDDMFLVYHVRLATSAGIKPVNPIPTHGIITGDEKIVTADDTFINASEP